MRSLKWCIGIAVAIPLQASYAAALTVQPDKENVVASRLAGTWELAAELNRRLGGRDAGKFAFKSDPSVVGKIPAKYEPFLKGKRIYMAGVMTRRDVEHPFVLIEHSGNPHVVYFRERNGDPLGDSESFNVMLVAAMDEGNDLLFVGGDFNNQPFTAFRRMMTEAN